jgi:nucleoside diphosphate kinase
MEEVVVKPVKVCREHTGEIENSSNRAGLVSAKRYCLFCKRMYAKKFNNSEKGKLCKIRYRKSGKYKSYSKEYYNKYNKTLAGVERNKKHSKTRKAKISKEKYRSSEKGKSTIRKYSKWSYCGKYILIKIKNLADVYIKHLLRMEGISNENMTPELIKIKRLFVKANRLINQEKKYVNQKQ